MISWIRTFLERISRGRVIRRKILIAGKSIPILVSPDAQLKYLKFGSGAFDNDLISLAEVHLKPGLNVWDIGANVGVFTFAASAIVETGFVVSVEADIWLAGLLRRTLHLQSMIGSASGGGASFQRLSLTKTLWRLFKSQREGVLAIP